MATSVAKFQENCNMVCKSISPLEEKRGGSNPKDAFFSPEVFQPSFMAIANWAEVSIKYFYFSFNSEIL